MRPTAAAHPAERGATWHEERPCTLWATVARCILPSAVAAHGPKVAGVTCLRRRDRTW